MGNETSWDDEEPWNDKDFKENTSKYLTQDYYDFKASMKFVNEYFDENIFKQVDEWETCIKVENKGSLIFKEQQNRSPSWGCRHVIKHLQIKDRKKLIEDKDIIIFDDSIITGKTMSGILDILKPLKPRRIRVFCLLSIENAANKLKSETEYPNVDFNLGEPCSKWEDFWHKYFKLINPYMEYICLPIQKAHPLLIIKFRDTPNETQIYNFFSNFGDLASEKPEYLKDMDDRFKYRLVFNPGVIDQIDIFNIMKDLQHVSMEDLKVKTRIYLRKDRKTLILQPMILESLETGSLKVLNNQDVKTLKPYISLIDSVAKRHLIDFWLRAVENSHLMADSTKITKISILY